MKQNKKLGVLKKALVLLGAVAVCGFGMNSMQASAAGQNVIQNGDFADGDVSMWTTASGNATISTAESDTAIFGDVKTYGVISGRTASYECFAQDITALVKNGTEYEYEFYCMLSDDYAGAPDDQRVVEFAPYITVDGTTTYLGSWSGEITGTASQTLTPGEWTKYSGTFLVDYSGNLDQLVIRLLEQGTNYGAGECVKGEYYVTGVTLKEKAAEEIVLDDVVALKDEVTADLGEEAIVGTAVTATEIRDKGVKAIIEKHFNAVSIGNELKPDALFGYSNSRCPGTEEVELNGKTITVPKLDYSRAEKILDAIYDWNQANPDHFIKVRGHVLVWHSQTPEWFFHEDYDKTKPYVTPEEMNVRLEWFIKTVLEHFTGEDSKYKGMFYGWDVVNEAISDASGTYRSDAESAYEDLSQDTHGSNSSWWHVYQSNEYIINAFCYANKYAPADVELYYNDYNETNYNKMEGILALLEAVKSADGTRIDGMGMQGHYSTSDPDLTRFKMAIKKYSDAIGSVMITEWDLRASSAYDGTEATKADEYARQAYRYMNLYSAMVELKEEGYNVDGLTMWGTVDKYSWLQTSSSVGGGATGTQKQCPLLFDDNYEVKPSFWAIADVDKMKEVLNDLKEEVAAESEEESSQEAPVEESSEVSAESQETDAQVSEESEDAAADVEENEGGTSNVLGIVIAVIAVVAIVVAGVLVAQKKKKK